MSGKRCHWQWTHVEYIMEDKKGVLVQFTSGQTLISYRSFDDLLKEWREGGNR